MDDKDLEKLASRVASGKSGRIRTAGKIEFIRDQGPIRRDIRVQGFNWSPDSLRNLAKILWAAQRAHSFSLAATRLFSKMPSSQFSPDGLLGGRGYIQSIKDMRSAMSQATEILSTFTDTLFDEVNGDHWQSPEQEEKDISGIVEKAEAVKTNPEDFVESEFTEETDESFDEPPVENPKAEDYNPQFNSPKSDADYEAEEDSEDTEGQYQTAASFAETAQKEKKVRKRLEDQKAPDESGSQLPGGTGPQAQGISTPEFVMKTTLSPQGNYAASINRILRAHEMRQHERTASIRTADTSLPVETIPGPRVDHIGPAEGNEAGHYNDGEEWPSDDPTGEGLSSGVNDTKQVYEDWCADGVTGYSDATDGDSSIYAIGSRLAAAPQTYSWLPGANNDKNMNYYELGLSDDDINWMKAHAAPEPPPSLYPKAVRPSTSELWESNL